MLNQAPIHVVQKFMTSLTVRPIHQLLFLSVTSFVTEMPMLSSCLLPTRLKQIWSHRSTYSAADVGVCAIERARLPAYWLLHGGQIYVKQDAPPVVSAPAASAAAAADGVCHQQTIGCPGNADGRFGCWAQIGVVRYVVTGNGRSGQTAHVT